MVNMVSTKVNGYTEQDFTSKEVLRYIIKYFIKKEQYKVVKKQNISEKTLLTRWFYHFKTTDSVGMRIKPVDWILFPCPTSESNWDTNLKRQPNHPTRKFSAVYKERKRRRKREKKRRFTTILK